MKTGESTSALGLRAHSGWAAMVAVAIPNSQDTPRVIHRRRIELADPRIPGSMQPFHAAKAMELIDAEAFLNTRAEESRTMATVAIRDAVAALAERGYRITSACVLAGSGRAASSLAATLASHPMIHTAEGNFFRNALLHACEACGLKTSAIREKNLVTNTAAAMGITVQELQRIVSEMAKGLGPPWKQDEKLSAIAAWTISL